MRTILPLLLIAVPAVVQAQNLTETGWQLVSFGPSGSETRVVPGTTVTARFGEDGRVGGSTGCNNYGGTYEVRGDTISIGRLISTKRACLDQNANEQERRFLGALEAANSFRLTSGRLTITSQRGRTALNFASTTPPEPQEPPTEDRSDPLETLANYFSAINAKEFRRAYRLWETPPSSFEQFASGFADTERVRLLIEPSLRMEGAAGSLYAEIPMIIVSSRRAGNERVFAGCYVMRRSNVRDRGWLIYRANVSQFPSSARISRLLSQGCR